MEQGNLEIIVVDTSNAALENASIKIDGKTGSTLATGAATITGISAGDQVVRISRTGFISQSVRTNIVAGTTTRLLVTLRPGDIPKLISRIENAQTIASPVLHASITIPENAFVTASGQAATGPVTVEIVPWDMGNTDASAMLGNGKAKAANGELTDLLSAGMITANFIAADGSLLQLAPGKTAVLHMDTGSIVNLNGLDLLEGTQVPLWYFDEAQGLWLEDGVGTVVTSSATGNLTLEATVSHFTTWNWDVKFSNPGSVDVSCVEENSNTPVSCFISAAVRLPGGAVLAKTGFAQAGAATHIINMPSDAEITWTARTAADQLGTATSTLSGGVSTPGSVTITLNAPKTSNFVQCSAAKTFDVCDVHAVFNDALGNMITERNYRIPASGTTIRTGVDAVSIDWSGAAINVSNGIFTFLDSPNSTSSGPSDPVVIALDSGTTISASRYIGLKCPTAKANGEVTITTCTMNVTATTDDGLDVVLFNGTAGAGVVVPIAVPPGINPLIRANAFYPEFEGSDFMFLFDSDIIDGKVYEFGSFGPPPS